MSSLVLLFVAAEKLSAKGTARDVMRTLSPSSRTCKDPPQDEGKSSLLPSPQWPPVIYVQNSTEQSGE